MNFLKRYFFIIFLSVSFQGLVAQVNDTDSAKSKELLKKAGKSFLDLECQKSLNFAKASLEISLKNYVI